MERIFTFFVGALAALTCGIASAHQPGHVLREEKSVAVDGIQETWQLVWEGKPAESLCGPHQVFMAITCPCTGFGYAEQGKLFLVRHHGGRQIERMALSPLFGGIGFDNPVWRDNGRLAVLPRWGEPVVPGDADRESAGDPRLVPEIMHREKTTALKLADYDHDGRATEFLLHVANMPCGNQYDVAVGISRNAPRLHALTSVATPGKPLLLPRHAWAALLTGAGKHDVVEWECGDHGSDLHQELTVSSDNGRISARRRDFSCPFDAGHPNLLSDEAF